MYQSFWGKYCIHGFQARKVVPVSLNIFSLNSNTVKFTSHTPRLTPIYIVKPPLVVFKYNLETYLGRMEPEQDPLSGDRTKFLELVLIFLALKFLF